MTPGVRLAMLCAIAGIDLDDLIDRSHGPCICGHARESHEAADSACACTAEECGCPGFVIPPPTVPR